MDRHASVQRPWHVASITGNGEAGQSIGAQRKSQASIGRSLEISLMNILNRTQERDAAGKWCQD